MAIKVKFKTIFLSAICITTIFILLENTFLNLYNVRFAEWNSEVQQKITENISGLDNFPVTAPVIIQNPPIILFWTKFYTSDFVPSLTLYKEAVRDLEFCPAPKCRLTNDRQFLNESAAVVFHITETDFNPDDLPVFRPLHQYYIFYGIESPVHTRYDLTRLDGFFNLTFTYRLDSDIISDSYFQHFHPTVFKNDQEYDELFLKKKKFAVIFVSNCEAPSGRRLYLKELKNVIPVDVYGSCGDKQCSISTPEFCDRLIEEYKFYFAFENRYSLLQT